MKKIIIAIAAMAAAFTMASCNKEQPVSPNENPTVGKSVITASIGNDFTKTSLQGNDTDGYKVLWSEGDKLFVTDYCFEDWAAEYTLDKSSEDSPMGSFEWHDGDYFFPFSNEYSEPVFERGIEYFAVYPSDFMALNNMGSATALTWRMDQLYGATNLYVPMMTDTVESDGTAPEFEFKNLGGLLRLKVKGKAHIRKIRISVAESISGAVSGIANFGDGPFAVMKDGAPMTSCHITLDCGEGGVPLTDTGTDFYISMPTAHYTDKQGLITDGYSDVTITLTDTEGKTCVKKLSSDKKLVIERSKITTASFTASEFKSDISGVALAGKFSVGEDKQVYFSQGNLYHDGNEFCFETEQNAYHGYDSGTSTWGLFGWSTSAAGNHYGMSTSTVNSVYSGDFADWGSAIDGNTTWRTLTIDEWEYLFSNHSNKWVTVNGVNGYVIAPDGVTLSEVATSYTEDELKQGNLVFLPAAGYRYASLQGTSVYYANEFGFYWSSTDEGQDGAYYMQLYDENVSLDNIGVRSFGYSVRLVTDCE